MMTFSALYAGQVAHQRIRPVRHRLAYRVFYLAIDLDELNALDARLKLFSINRMNLFSLYARDHGDGSQTPLREQVRSRLNSAGLAAGGRILLFTMPRMLGYAFNPLSLYLCFDESGRLAAILYEVNNTFGQRHVYAIPAFEDEYGLIRQEATKSLYVSPFLDTDMRYAFVLRPPGERIALSITASDCDGAILLAKLVAKRKPLNDATLIGAFLAYPFLTLKVIMGIHWEALRILLKGVRPTKRPPQMTNEMTLGRIQEKRPVPTTAAQAENAHVAS
jgi:uncharacterized protein